MNRYYRYLILMVVAAFVVFQGCSDDSTKSKKVDEFKLAAELSDVFFNGGVKTIKASDLNTALQTNADDYYILDIRSSAHFELGHIADAHNMAAADITENLAEIPADKIIVVVCYTGQTASQTTGYLRVLGYDAYTLLWGMCGWTNDPAIPMSTAWLTLVPTDAALETTPHDITAQPVQDYPEFGDSEDDAAEIVKTHMDAYIGAGWKMVAAADVWANLDDYFIIDLREETYYNAGHIPGAFRVNMADLGYGESLKYLPADQPIMVVCYTSHTANQVTSVLNMLGYDAYNLRYGMNAVTANTEVCKVNYSAPAENYPVVTD